MKINATFLAGQPCFERLSARQIEILLEEARPVTFQDGEVIFNEGEPANRFYLILSGKVVLESRSQEYGDERQPVLIDTLGEGDALGWSWMIPPFHWHFDARAVSPITAIFFYGTRLRERCEADHEFGFELMKQAAEVAVRRLNATRRRLLEVAHAQHAS